MELRDRLTILVIMGVRTDEHCLRSQVGIGSESDCLLGQLCKILEISDSEAGLKVEKVGGVVGGGTECGESAEELAICAICKTCMHNLQISDTYLTGLVHAIIWSYLLTRTLTLT